MEGFKIPKQNIAEKIKRFVSRNKNIGFAFLSSVFIGNTLQAQDLTPEREKEIESYNMEDSISLYKKQQDYFEKNNKFLFSKHNQGELIFSNEPLPPVYTRNPVSEMDKKNLDFYYKDYQNKEKLIREHKLKARIEPFNVEKFYWWKDYDKSIWPKYAIYVIEQDSIDDTHNSWKGFFIPPVPLYEENTPQQAGNNMRKSSQNFPGLNEVYSRMPDGSFQFDYYEDSKTKANLGNNFKKPGSSEKKN